jgi:hypothetical protein
MAFAQKVNRITMIGTMYGGSEIWSTGFWAGHADSDAPAPTDGMAESVADEWQTFFTAGSVLISYLFKTATIKVTPYNVDGTINVPGIKTFSYATPIVGAHTGNGHPPQCAVVATLVAGNGVGLAGKGRMYIPGVGDGVDPTGHMTTSTCTSIASGLSTFFANVNASFDSPGEAINAAHRPLVIDTPTPINRALTAVKVGNVFDTQRRRRNALTEVYSLDTI